MHYNLTLGCSVAGGGPVRYGPRQCGGGRGGARVGSPGELEWLCISDLLSVVSPGLSVKASIIVVFSMLC